LTGVYGLEAQLGVAAVLVVAIVGTLLVIPTGGEIPIILTLLPLGVGAGVTGALLVALPALSIPSMVMVGRDMGWRTTAAMGAAVAVAAVLAGAALTLLGCASRAGGAGSGTTRLRRPLTVPAPRTPVRSPARRPATSTAGARRD